LKHSWLSNPPGKWPCHGWSRISPFIVSCRVSDAFDETYRMIINPGHQSVTLFCVDPSNRLAQTLKGLRAAVFFSATLSPLDYFIDVLGGSAGSAKG
jgi:Rad3-related DNA helicase